MYDDGHLTEGRPTKTWLGRLKGWLDDAWHMKIRKLLSWGL